jgi:hypothetical protein
MTHRDRPRTDPIAAHAYTLPVVREVPIAAGPASTPRDDLRGVGQPLVYAADAHAW